ncbi:MAG TPA: PTS sugar transporter subunit IIA [Patescibacteria group bacterium]|nr:PTS sugar transporter subunit IIA [Patescibacteria group bacterium]
MFEKENARQYTPLPDINTVLPELRCVSLSQVMQEIAHRAAADQRLPYEYLMERIMSQGQRQSLGVGNGVAIAEMRLRRLRRPYVLFARTARPVDVHAVDGMPADLILLVLSPAGDMPGHLRRLSRLSRIMRDRDFCEKLREADNADALHALFLLPRTESLAA